MILELLGLPASGKTHVAKYLKEQCGCDRVTTRSRMRMLRYATLFWIRHPIFTYKLILLIVVHSEGFFDFYSKCMNGLGHHLARYYIPTCSKCRVVDEGVLHNILTLSNDPLSEKAIVSLLRSMPKISDAYVCIQASDRARNERAIDRGYMLTRTRDKKKAKEWETSIARNEQILLRLLPQFIEQPIFVIQSSESDQVVDFVKQRTSIL